MNDHSSPDSEPRRLALLGHELRTPLNAIIGYAEAMTLEVFGPLPAPYAEHAGVIHRAAAHLLALIDDISDQAEAVSGVWTGVRTVFDPVVLAREVISLLAARAARMGVAITLTADETLGEVHADRRAMRQILLNLCDNALKFTAADGRVSLALARDAGGLRLAVADTGGAEGEKGQGLGLRLVRALASAHAGTVEIGPPIGPGATVIVRLPILES